MKKPSQKLTKFTVSFNNNSQIQSPSILLILKIIKNQQNLSYLSLDFSSFEDNPIVEDPELKEFQKIIKKSTINLKYLELLLKGCSISE